VAAGESPHGGVAPPAEAIYGCACGPTPQASSWPGPGPGETAVEQVGEQARKDESHGGPASSLPRPRREVPRWRGLARHRGGV